jgi:hypothetical protein
MNPSRSIGSSVGSSIALGEAGPSEGAARASQGVTRASDGTITFVGPGARTLSGQLSAEGTQEFGEGARSVLPPRPLQATTLGNTTKRLTRKISAAFSSDVEAAVLKASKPKYTAPKEKYVLTLLAALQGSGEAFFYLLETLQQMTSANSAGTNVTDVGTAPALGRVTTSHTETHRGDGRGSSSTPMRRATVAVMSTKPQYGLNKVSTFHVQRLPHHRYRHPSIAPWPTEGNEQAEEIVIAMERVLLCGDIVRKLWRHGMERDWRIVCKVLMVAHRLMRDTAAYADSIIFRLWAIYYDRGLRSIQLNESEGEAPSTETATAPSQRETAPTIFWELLTRLVSFANNHSPRGQRERARRLGSRNMNPNGMSNAMRILSGDIQTSAATPSALNLASLETLASSFRDESRTRPEASACSLFVRHYAKYLWVRLESFRLLYLGEYQQSSMVAELGDSFVPPNRLAETGSQVDEMGVVSSRFGEELRERIPFERALGQVIPVLLFELESATAVRLESVLEAASNPMPNSPGGENMASVNVHNEIIMEAARLIIHDVMQLFTTTNILMESVLEQQLLLGSSHLALMRRSRALYLRFVGMTNRMRQWLECISRCMLRFDPAPPSDARNRRRALGNAAADAMIRGELEHAPLNLIERGWWANLAEETCDHRPAMPVRSEDNQTETCSGRREKQTAATLHRPRSERTFSAQSSALGSHSWMAASTGSKHAESATSSPLGAKHALNLGLQRASSMKDIVETMESVLLGATPTGNQTGTDFVSIHGAAKAVEHELRALDQTYESCKVALERLYNNKRAEILARPIQSLSRTNARRPSV